MDSFLIRAPIRSHMCRRAATALSSLYVQKYCGGFRNHAFRLNGLQLMVVSSRLGRVHSRNLVAWCIGRSPFLFDTFPIFRPSFSLPTELNSNGAFIGSHDIGRCYSARPVRNEHAINEHESSHAVEKQDFHRPSSSFASHQSVPLPLRNGDPSVQGNVPLSGLVTKSEDHGTPLNNSMVSKPADKPEARLDDLSDKGVVQKVEAHVEEFKAASTEVEKPGLFKRFHMMYKQYGAVLVGVHVFTSSIWAGMFYYAAVSGVDVIPVLKWMGASDKVMAPFLLPGVGHAAVTYLMYKLATPARYTVTIAGTQLAVRYLRSHGYFKEPKTVDGKPDSLRSIVTDGRAKVKDRMEDIREDMHELKEKIEHLSKKEKKL